jgi:hypothetical protein
MVAILTAEAQRKQRKLDLDLEKRGIERDAFRRQDIPVSVRFWEMPSRNGTLSHPPGLRNIHLTSFCFAKLCPATDSVWVRASARTRHLNDR